MPLPKTLPGEGEPTPGEPPPPTPRPSESHPYNPALRAPCVGDTRGRWRVAIGLTRRGAGPDCATCRYHGRRRARPRAEAESGQDGAHGREHAGPRRRGEDAEPTPAHHRHPPRRGGGAAPGRAAGAARILVPSAGPPQPRAPARRDTLQVPDAVLLGKHRVASLRAGLCHLPGQEEHPEAGRPPGPREGEARGPAGPDAPPHSLQPLRGGGAPPQGCAPRIWQEHYDQLQWKISHAWDLVVTQAREQLRAMKQRRRGDRLVITCQEQAYWLVNRPPPGVPNVLEQGPERGSCAASRLQTCKSLDFYKWEIEYARKALGRNRLKSSVCLEAYLKFSSQRGPHDPILSGCLPSNPWVTDDDTYWAVNAPTAATPTRLRVERWGFSFQELLEDPVGRAHFMDFLEKEFSAENLSFWEACEQLRYGGQAQVPALVDAVYQQFLAPGAARWVNIDSRTMERTLAGLCRPHRYVLDDAQLHIYMLMKKDSYPRFLKSDMYKGLLTEATVPVETKRRVFPFMRKPRHCSPSPALPTAGPGGGGED
ncbi:regulator of G-protein signaling 11 isoform X2 [Oryctolagus cuniculus]|uniref:regulator of G-protein signaling 11 isoform X2 n=1 Tax=Oryctolagus cuniculus TaxID=9986 RepID=UPI0038790F18